MVRVSSQFVILSFPLAKHRLAGTNILEGFSLALFVV